MKRTDSEKTFYPRVVLFEKNLSYENVIQKGKR